MRGIATSLAWSNAHTASRRRCLGIRGTREIGVVTSQDAADPPLRYPACNLSVEPRIQHYDPRPRTAWRLFLPDEIVGSLAVLLRIKCRESAMIASGRL